jgi:hypothetical protein
VGEAVTSMLEAKGAPGVAERTLIRPPSSQLGPIDAATRAAVNAASPFAGKYDTAVDRDSAHEMLARRAAAAAKAAEEAERAETEGQAREFSAARRYSANGDDAPPRKTGGSGSSFGGEVAKVVIKELKGTTGRRIVRGVLGTLFKAR